VKVFAIFIALLMNSGCDHLRRRDRELTQEEIAQAITKLRAAYAAFNRGDIDSAVAPLDPKVEWTEPAEFPGGGTYYGIEGVKKYLTQSRAGAAQVISEPEEFRAAGNRIVVLVHARVLPRRGNTWQDVRLADVYTFHNAKITNMRAFADRSAALRWVGLENPIK
jgi:ketosteroid isomerase-like protein